MAINRYLSKMLGIVLYIGFLYLFGVLCNWSDAYIVGALSSLTFYIPIKNSK